VTLDSTSEKLVMEDLSNVKPELQGDYAWIIWTVIISTVASLISILGIIVACASSHQEEEEPPEKRGRQLDPVKAPPMPAKTDASEEKKETPSKQELIWSLPTRKTATPPLPSSTRHTARRPALMALRSSTKRE
jgi:hypothetical protein